MRTRPALVAALAALGLVGLSPAADEPAHASGCGSINLGGRGYVFYKQGLTCSKARELAAYVYRTRRAPDRRWRCSSGSNYRSGAYCKRRGALFGWHPGD